MHHVSSVHGDLPCLMVSVSGLPLEVLRAGGCRSQSTAKGGAGELPGCRSQSTSFPKGVLTGGVREHRRCACWRTSGRCARWQAPITNCGQQAASGSRAFAGLRGLTGGHGDALCVLEAERPVCAMACTHRHARVAACQWTCYGIPEHGPSDLSAGCRCQRLASRMVPDSWLPSGGQRHNAAGCADAVRSMRSGRCR